MSDPSPPIGGVVSPCLPQALAQTIPSSIPQGLTYVRSTSPSNPPSQPAFHGHGRRGTSNDLIPIQGNAGERIYMFTDHSGQIHTFTQSELNDLNDLTAQLASTYGQVPTQGVDASPNNDNSPLATTADSPSMTSSPSPNPQRTSYPTPESESMGSPDLEEKQMPQAFALSSTSFDNILSTIAPVPEGDYTGTIYAEPTQGSIPSDLYVIPELPKACVERFMSPSTMSMHSTDPNTVVLGEEGESSRSTVQIQRHIPTSPPVAPENLRGQRTMSKSSQGPLRTKLQGFNENLKRMRPSSFDSFRSLFSRPGSYASSHGSVTVVGPIPGLPTSPLATAEIPGSPESISSGDDPASPEADTSKTSKKNKSVKKVKTEKTEEEKREYNRMKASKSMKGLANDTMEMGEILKQNREILQFHNIDLPEDADGGRPMQKPAIVRTAKTALGRLLPRFAVVGNLRAEKENLESNCAQLNRQRENMMIMVQGLQLQMEKLRIEVEGLNTQKTGLVTDVQELLFRRETLINEVSVAQQHLQGLNFQITQVSAIRPAGPRVRPRQPLGKSSLEHEVIPDS